MSKQQSWKKAVTASVLSFVAALSFAVADVESVSVANAEETLNYDAFAVSADDNGAFISPAAQLEENDVLTFQMDVGNFTFGTCSWIGFGVCSAMNFTNPYIHTLPDSTLIAYNLSADLGNLGEAGSDVTFNSTVGYRNFLMGKISVRAEFTYKADGGDYALSIKQWGQTEYTTIQTGSGILMSDASMVGMCFYGAEFRSDQFLVTTSCNGESLGFYTVSNQQNECYMLYNHTVSYVTGTTESIAPSVVHHRKKIGELNTSANGSKTEKDVFTQSGDSAYWATSAPANPTQPNMAFEGWYLDQNYTRPFDIENDVVTSDITLYAKWASNITVDFETNGGDPLAQKKVGEGSTLDEITPVREGYQFVGWYTDLALTQAFDYATPVQESMKLYAKWNGDYEVKFFVEEELVRFISLNAGENYSDFPDLPQKTGYTARWSVSTIENISENVTANAVYERILLTITFDDGTVQTPVTVLYGDAFTGQLPMVTPKAGFDGRWETTSFPSVTESVTVHAVYEPVKITVTFRADGFDDIVRYADYQSPLYAVPAVPYKEGFVGVWDVTDFTTVTDDMTVNAVYTPKTCVVVFHNEAPVTLSVAYGESLVNVPAVDVKTGYMGAWSVVDFSNVTDDMDVYPVYEKQTFTVSFFVDGREYHSETVAYMETCVLPENPTKTGATFVGWTFENGETATLDEVQEDTEIFAQFQAKKFTVTFLVNGKVVSVQSVEYGKGATAPTLTDEQKTNFKKWDTDFSSVKSDMQVNAAYATTGSINEIPFALPLIVGACVLTVAAVTAFVILNRRKKNGETK